MATTDHRLVKIRMATSCRWHRLAEKLGHVVPEAVIVAVLASACGGGRPALPPATTGRFPDLPALVRGAEVFIHADAVGPLQRAMVFSTTRLGHTEPGQGPTPIHMTDASR
jgi:hypothetical protein